jgi:hypothetical protein
LRIDIHRWFAILFLRIDIRHCFWNWEPCYDPSDHIISCYYYYYSFFLRQKIVRHISRRCLDQTL